MPPVNPRAVAARNGPPSTTDEIRNRMRSCSAGAHTKPEMRLRRALHARGIRYRLHTRIEIPGRRAVRPDIVWKSERLAVFVDGCFWHGCPEHANPPKSNLDYWVPKLARNVERDREQTEALIALGWRVVRIWEHELKTDAAAEHVALRIYLIRSRPWREALRRALDRNQSLVLDWRSQSTRSLEGAQNVRQR